MDWHGPFFFSHQPQRFLTARSGVVGTTPSLNLGLNLFWKVLVTFVAQQLFGYFGWVVSCMVGKVMNIIYVHAAYCIQSHTLIRTHKQTVAYDIASGSAWSWWIDGTHFTIDMILDLVLHSAVASCNVQILRSQEAPYRFDGRGRAWFQREQNLAKPSWHFHVPIRVGPANSCWWAAVISHSDTSFLREAH